MRTSLVMLCAILTLSGSAAFGEIANPEKESYPGAVALSQEVSGQWIFKSFPSFLPLYIFEGDPPGKSNCDEICTAVWPIIRAQDGDKTLGQWTVVQRADGRKQWAYKGKPVYMYFEDEPNDPVGAGKEEGWYLEENAGLTKKGAASKVAAKKAGNKPTWQLLIP